eukprot:gene1523-27854_t
MEVVGGLHLAELGAVQDAQRVNAAVPAALLLELHVWGAAFVYYTEADLVMHMHSAFVYYTEADLVMHMHSAFVYYTEADLVMHMHSAGALYAAAAAGWAVVPTRHEWVNTSRHHPAPYHSGAIGHGWDDIALCGRSTHPRIDDARWHALAGNCSPFHAPRHLHLAGVGLLVATGC